MAQDWHGMLVRNLGFVGERLPAAASFMAPSILEPLAVSKPVGAPAIDRVGLLARLERSRTGRVTVMQAPAGYGKSQLLASWTRTLRQQGVTVVWPDLDDDTSEASRFLATLVVAADNAVSTGTSVASSALQTASPRFAARRLTDIFQRVAGDIVVVVDDYDRVSGDEVDALLGELIRTQSASVHWVLVSRTQLQVPLGALWYESKVTLLGQKELRLSDAEIADIFEHRLAPADLARISIWTEGWPVAVQLVRHYLSSRAPSDEDLDQLLGRANGDISHFLTEQVLGSLPERHRELLILSSFLDEFRIDLIEAVTGIEPAWRIVQDLQNSNVLIEPVDENEGWYRCHRLLREVMFGQLRRRGRSELARVHLIAARWFQGNGLLREALRHASAAGDFDLAARLVLDAGGIFYGIRYGGPALRLLMDFLPPEIVGDYPRLSLAQICVLTKEGRIDVAADVLRAIRQRYRDVLGSPERHADPLLVRDAAMAELMIAVYSGFQVSRTAVATLEAAASDAPAEAFWLHSIVYNLLCITRYRSSDFPGALAAAATAFYYYGEARSSNGTGHMHVHVGLITVESADPISAQTRYRSARGEFEHGLCGDDAGCAITDILTGEACYEQGQLNEARRLCMPALEIAERGECHYDWLVPGYRTLTALALIDEGAHAAVRLVGRGIAFARRRRFVELERYLNLRRLELQFEAGEYSTLAPAGGLAVEPLRGRPGTEIVPWREQDLRDLLEARLTLRCGDAAAVIEILDAKLAQLELAGRTRSRVRFLIQLAIAYDVTGRQGDASDALQRAIALGQPGGLLMPFVEAGRSIMPLMAQLVTASGQNGPDLATCEFARQVMRIGSAAGVTNFTIFSPREQEIVRLLVQGTNNKLMARSLGISPDTVRFHLKSIYEKFGVNDRKVVAVLARERGLLD